MATLRGEMNVNTARRVVVDTNVWISAALSTTGAPAQVLRRVLQQGVPVFSAATFAELEVRLWKPKFDRYISMDARRHVLRDANAAAHWVVIPEQIAVVAYSRDVEDDKFIHIALAASAAWLVTGDKDLLVLQKVLSVEVLTPSAALERMSLIDE
jgi:uncharacterized protein